MDLPYIRFDVPTTTSLTDTGCRPSSPCRGQYRHWAHRRVLSCPITIWPEQSLRNWHLQRNAWEVLQDNRKNPG